MVDEQRWAARPWFARLVKVAAFVTPIGVSIAVCLWISSFVERPSSFWKAVVWWVVVSAIATVIVTIVDRVSRRLLPLSALFGLSLVFPDEAPSRFRTALRSGTVSQLRRQIDQARTEGLGDDAGEAARRLVELAGALSIHDRLTRGHSERVRAYTKLIAEELYLSEREVDRLQWAGLAHDVGKLFVDPEILNKPGKLTDEEYEAVKAHTTDGAELVGPLAGWLGEAAKGVGEHHERWDGKGYPNGLAGNEISLAGRMIAVADVFDVITSVRSYKKAHAVTAARQELVRCSGTQFDPKMVRAFLNIGLGKLRLLVGPLSWVAQLPVASRIPVGGALGPIVGGAAAGFAVVFGGLVGAPDPAEASHETAAPPVTVLDTEPADAVRPEAPVEIAATPDEPRTTEVEPTEAGDPPAVLPPAGPPTTEPPWEPTFVPVEPEDDSPPADPPADPPAPPAEEPPPTTTVPPTPPPTAPPTTTTVPPTTTTTTVPPTTTTTVPPTTTTTVPPTTATTVPAPPPPVPPSATDDVATVAEDGTVLIDVLANDTAGSGGAPSIQSAGSSVAGTVTIESGQLRFAPAADVNGPAAFVYTIVDGNGETDGASVAVDITPVNDDPVAEDEAYSVDQGATLTVPAPGLLANDSDVDGDALQVDPVPVSGPANGSIALGADGSLSYTPSVLFVGLDTFTDAISDGNGGTSSATVQVFVDSTLVPQSLYLGVGDPSSTRWPLEASPRAPSFQEPDHDGDGEDGLTIADSNQKLEEPNPAKSKQWIWQPAAPLSLKGPVTLDLWSTVAEFDDGDLDYSAWLLDCDLTGADCQIVTSTLDVHIDEWNRDVSDWVLRTLPVGSADHVVLPGRSLELRLMFDHDDAWIAMSGTRASRLDLTLGNATPVAVPDAFTVLQDSGPNSLDVLANDVDSNLDPASVTVVTPGALGTATAQPDGTITYEPAPGLFGVDSFTYRVCDTDGACAVAVVVVTVDPVIAPP